LTTFEFNQELEDRFVSLVEESWRRFDDMERNSWLDDVFVGAVITAHLDAGMFLLSVRSDGEAHFLKFSDQDRNRRVVRVDHRRGEDYLYAKTVGHLTACTFGVGRAYPDLGKVFSASKAEFKSGFAGEGRVAGMADPGVMKVDVDKTIAVCETTLLLDLSDYVNLDDFSVDTEKLWTHTEATYQSLEKYLSGIMK
jgi:hypothetical protein